jgi:hypothetical protein
MAKKDAKAKGKGVTALKSGQSSTTPAPYQPPPIALKPFLFFLKKEHIYITHIDTHLAQFKMRIFLVPLAMNLALILALVYRGLYIGPYYFALAMTALGYPTPYAIDPYATGWGALLDETVRRTLVLLFDFMLITFVVPWPYDFFLGSPASPVWWRICVGFQPEEIVVRRSRRSWDTKLPATWLEENDVQGASVYRERIMPAIDREWVRAKTSYLMMDKNWDLDFGCMINAHELVDQDKCSLDDFKKQVLVYSEQHGGWMVWPVWKLDEKPMGNPSQDTEAGRQKIVLFREKLTAMGKEDLFFRWIELIQFEASQPGGFTEKRQAHAMQEARKLFEEQGVDFDAFWKDVGGMEGMPGMQKAEDDEQGEGEADKDDREKSKGKGKGKGKGKA